ncbi:Conserved_hypothetical protein [Hexamita inflata]|uniref:Uncharacterized protein n=1 Tax=Hexamita inflata TaxID=28002 RepID=A0AA86UIU3_9EUKA|nr:Conserved hypothetical protein [Hexamita inflata]
MIQIFLKKTTNLQKNKQRTLLLKNCQKGVTQLKLVTTLLLSHLQPSISNQNSSIERVIVEATLKTEVYTVRKINTHSLFSFTILVYTQKDIERALNGDPTPGSTTIQPLYTEELIKNESGKMFLISILFNKTYSELAKNILSYVFNYAQSITIPVEVQFRESFINIFKQLLSIEFQLLSETRLVISEKQGLYVTEMKLEKAGDDWQAQLKAMYDYIVGQIPTRYHTIINGIYQVRKNNQIGELKETEIDEKILVIADQAVQEYLFSTDDEIKISLTGYDPDFIKNNLFMIKAVIEKRVFGDDRVRVGVSLNDELFVNISKARKPQGKKWDLVDQIGGLLGQ